MSRFSQDISVDKSSQFGKTPQISSQPGTVPGKFRCCIDLESSSPRISLDKERAMDNLQQSIQSFCGMDRKYLRPELSEFTSISNLNFTKFGNKLRQLDVGEVQMDQSLNLEEDEGLKMKMNIVLMPKRFQSAEEFVGIDEHQSEAEINSLRTVSSLNSTTTATTYESTQDSS